jgi:hypothetical protein
MNVSIFSKMAYENNHNWTLGENKPNQSQFPSKNSNNAKNFKNALSTFLHKAPLRLHIQSHAT